MYFHWKHTNNFQFSGVTCTAGKVSCMTGVVAGMMPANAVDSYHGASFAQFGYRDIHIAGNWLIIECPENL